nr:hypothetical protein CFP56_72400 [Quercus suber]
MSVAAPADPANLIRQGVIPSELLIRVGPLVSGQYDDLNDLPKRTCWRLSNAILPGSPLDWVVARRSRPPLGAAGRIRPSISRGCQHLSSAEMMGICSPSVSSISRQLATAYPINNDTNTITRLSMHHPSASANLHDDQSRSTRLDNRYYSVQTFGVGTQEVCETRNGYNHDRSISQCPHQVELSVSGLRKHVRRETDTIMTVGLRVFSQMSHLEQEQVYNICLLKYHNVYTNRTFGFGTRESRNEQSVQWDCFGMFSHVDPIHRGMFDVRQGRTLRYLSTNKEQHVNREQLECDKPIASGLGNNETRSEHSIHWDEYVMFSQVDPIYRGLFDVRQGRPLRYLSTNKA